MKRTRRWDTSSSHIINVAWGPGRPIPLAQRFWPKVRVTSGCWWWTASLVRGGYGSVATDTRGQRDAAHRVSWLLAHGPIPDGLFVLHRCDNRACVNPDHLWLGTQADNVHDAQQKGRMRVRAAPRMKTRRPASAPPDWWIWQHAAHAGRALQKETA